MTRNTQKDYETFEQFRQSSLAGKLFTRTFEHAEWGKLAAWVPTSWLVELANPHPLADTNTAGADGLPDRRVDLETLFESLLRDGMRDPLILGIGINHQVRLEAGNQRIRCLLSHNVPFVPVVGFVNETAVTNLANGTHEGRHMELNDMFLSEKYQKYVRPADAIVSVPLYTDAALASNGMF